MILKDFLRELPEPLCTTALHQMLMDALSVQLPGDVEGNAMLVLTIMECWPKVNQVSQKSFLLHSCHELRFSSCRVLYMGIDFYIEFFKNLSEALHTSLLHVRVR